jgi:pilin/secretion family protein with methylation motif
MTPSGNACPLSSSRGNGNPAPDSASGTAGASRSPKEIMTARKHRGFSLLELTIVIALGMTMCAVAIMTITPIFKSSDITNAYDTTLTEMRFYRNDSITNSKRYIIAFTSNQTFTVYYWGVAVPVSPAPVFVASYKLPYDIQYAVQAGFPNPGPDNFGSGTSANTLNTCATVGVQCVVFYPDGSAQDDVGNYNSGVIYLTRPSDNMYSSRAISIWGTTGRMRGWRLYLQGGSNKWVQQ